MDKETTAAAGGGYVLRFSASAGSLRKSVSFPVPEGMLEHMRALVAEQQQTGRAVFKVAGARRMVVELALLNLEQEF